MKFVTGLDKEMWTIVWCFIKPSKENIRSSKSTAKDEEGRQSKTATGTSVKCALCLEDQLLMMLMRLRLGQIEQELAYTFGINVSTVSRTIIAWRNFFVPSPDLGCYLCSLTGEMWQEPCQVHSRKYILLHLLLLSCDVKCHRCCLSSSNVILPTSPIQ